MAYNHSRSKYTYWFIRQTTVFSKINREFSHIYLKCPNCFILIFTRVFLTCNITHICVEFLFLNQIFSDTYYYFYYNKFLITIRMFLYQNVGVVNCVFFLVFCHCFLHWCLRTTGVPAKFDQEVITQWNRFGVHSNYVMTFQHASL